MHFTHDFNMCVVSALWGGRSGCGFEQELALRCNRLKAVVICLVHDQETTPYVFVQVPENEREKICVCVCSGISGVCAHS